MYALPLQPGDQVKWTKGRGCVILDKGKMVTILVESGEEKEIKKTKLFIY